jgi:hypothetical protein
MLFGIAWNMLGDGLNDALEPTTQRGFERRSLWRWRRKKRDLQAPVEEEVAPVILAPIPQTLPGEISMPAKKSPPGNGTDSILLSAREHLSHRDLSYALHAYRHLIQRGRQLDDVLPDLARLARAHPEDPRVWETLGDALARAGRLEQANQSYEQARKLKQ